MRRWFQALIAAFAACVLALPAAAQDWPTRPVRIIVPYPAGGPSDMATRITLDGLSAKIGQPVVFDNKAGASGAIGAEHVKNSPPDGYTFLTTTTAMVAITRHLQPLPYDPDKDFVTVARMATSGGVFAIHPSLPVKTVAEFVAYAKANPGKINFGSAGMATITQLYGEMLKLEAGIDMVHVPYRGSAPALQDLLAGQVQAQFDMVPLPHVKAGRLRGLAMLGERRWHEMPEIPTLKETGYGKNGGDSWFGILAPAGTPAPIVQRMAKAIDELLRDPATIAKLDQVSLFPTYLDPAAFRARITVESAGFADIIKRGNIKAH
jgi:tripartite-type tricarboxylate transporter receptor subunit TctC